MMNLRLCGRLAVDFQQYIHKEQAYTDSASLLEYKRPHFHLKKRGLGRPRRVTFSKIIHEIFDSKSEFSCMTNF